MHTHYYYHHSHYRYYGIVMRFFGNDDDGGGGGARTPRLAGAEAVLALGGEGAAAKKQATELLLGAPLE